MSAVKLLEDGERQKDRLESLDGGGIFRVRHHRKGCWYLISSPDQIAECWVFWTRTKMRWMQKSCPSCVNSWPSHHATDLSWHHAIDFACNFIAPQIKIAFGVCTASHSWSCLWRKWTISVCGIPSPDAVYSFCFYKFFLPPNSCICCNNLSAILAWIWRTYFFIVQDW